MLSAQLRCYISLVNLNLNLCLWLIEAREIMVIHLNISNIGYSNTHAGLTCLLRKNVSFLYSLDVMLDDLLAIMKAMAPNMRLQHQYTIQDSMM